MKLYSYWRSSSSYRVRVALNLKAVEYQTVPVNLLSKEQQSNSFSAINPSMGVPILELQDGKILTQSLAILRWLDDQYPTPPLLPTNSIEAAKVEAAAHVIAMEIHPVNNLRVLEYLKSNLGQNDRQRTQWMHYWMHEGLYAFQQLISPNSRFCFGDTPYLADICLAGQMVNARRWECDLAPFKRLVEIDAACNEIDAFRAALPQHQPDSTL